MYLVQETNKTNNCAVLTHYGGLLVKFAHSASINLHRESTVRVQLQVETEVTSGIVFSSSSFLYAQAVYIRKHLPAATRPARPAR